MFLGLEFDGGWVDAGTVGVAVSWCGAKCRKRRLLALALNNGATLYRTIVSPDSRNDFLAGAAIFRFVLLFASPFSSQILAGLLAANKLTLCMAGAVALFNVFGDF
jgi:hypothetical protein